MYARVCKVGLDERVRLFSVSDFPTVYANLALIRTAIVTQDFSSHPWITSAKCEEDASVDKDVSRLEAIRSAAECNLRIAANVQRSAGAPSPRPPGQSGPRALRSTSRCWHSFLPTISWSAYVCIDSASHHLGENLRHRLPAPPDPPGPRA